MSTLNIGDDLYRELESMARSQGLTPEDLAHKLMRAGVQHMIGGLQLDAQPESMVRFDEALATINTANGDIGNARDMVDTAARQMALVRDQLQRDAVSCQVFNETLGLVSDDRPRVDWPLGPPFERPYPGPGPIDPHPQPGERHCYECDKQEVCEIKAKLDSIVTHRMISLFGEHVDNLWRNLANACDAFWPVGGHPIRPMHGEGEMSDVIGHIGEDGQMQAAARGAGGHDDLGSRHTDGQSTVIGADAPMHRRVNQAPTEIDDGGR